MTRNNCLRLLVRSQRAVPPPHPTLAPRPLGVCSRGLLPGSAQCAPYPRVHPALPLYPLSSNSMHSPHPPAQAGPPLSTPRPPRPRFPHGSSPRLPSPSPPGSSGPSNRLLPPGSFLPLHTLLPRLNVSSSSPNRLPQRPAPSLASLCSSTQRTAPSHPFFSSHTTRTPSTPSPGLQPPPPPRSSIFPFSTSFLSSLPPPPPPFSSGRARCPPAQVSHLIRSLQWCQPLHTGKNNQARPRGRFPCESERWPGTLPDGHPAQATRTNHGPEDERRGSERAFPHRP